MSRDECRKYLRFLELDAYAKMVSALRAQGPLTQGKQKLLSDLATVLHISNDRHQAEIRRAVNDDKLSLIAEQLFGPNTEIEWSLEGRRIIPLFSRLKGRTAFTTFANSLSITTAIANDKQPHFSKKREGKLKDGSHCQSKYEDQLLNNDSENSFRTRKRKRSSHEVAGLNNSTYINYPSSSNNNPSSLVTEHVKQCFTNRQRIEIEQSKQCFSHENGEFRKIL